ncbi:MAG: BON domain-containing protein [Pelagibacteraceae bacterium]|jgi:osmotically-inducible protein OsmY|nr:BON domain-containing protein [Pelagibacteraceae bacterium]MDP6783861.1 BON domain-containing protein [Alphaproteobacteria bacterium]MBO6467839.1 BON domain-containing protein [Pelagibacteraceae bacterium]MBO6469008.1 BON domain-containing protein [Pelagibacteraceae bacterium]MBO6469855.1 BON domain-containing protein [Pelagibacteraceae bacterium]|tara:strand:- start:219 stop:800 length:582 start_codon:yes stop_codon:yes gene_type:complete
MIRSIILVIGLVFLSIVYGCSPAGVLASGGATTMVVAEGDKSLGTAVDDATIKLNISRKLLTSENNLFRDIDTSVIEGIVLLTGIVENQEKRIEAVKIVWEVDGVKEVINEIEIGEKTSIKEYANDVWITTQIKALAVRDIGLRSISYNVETIRGKVYLAGITSRPEQLETLVNIIKGVKGVNEVVNYVVIKE